MVKKKKTLGFYHVCMINHWKNIVKDQVKLILDSGLYERTDKILVGCVGKDVDDLRDLLPEKFEIRFHDENIQLYEIPTLQLLQDACVEDDFLLWYIHTKGAYSETKKSTVYLWRKIMEYFVIEKHEQCYQVMDRCDACGIDLRHLAVHFHNAYSGHFWVFIGNFWWSKSQYIRKLPNITQFWLDNMKSRYVAEVFIGLASSKLGTFYNRRIDGPVPAINYRRETHQIQFPLISML